jgi:hypothetical protein
LYWLFFIGASKSAKIISNRFYWRPGVRDSSKYENEKGSYKVEIIAKDKLGQTAKQTFMVEVNLLKFGIKKGNESIIWVTEKIHPDRKYNLLSERDGKKLYDIQCKSFDESKKRTITLKDYKITKKEVVDTSDGLMHEFGIDQLKVANRSFEKDGMEIFVSSIQLEANPKTSISSKIEAPDVKIIYMYASQCADDDNVCIKRVIEDKGMKNFYYCSEYFSGASLKEEMKSIYCQRVKSFGLSKSECN